MNAIPEPAAAAPSAAATALPQDSIAPLATGVADVVGAWASLLNLELALAQRSLRWLLIGAVAAAVAGVSAWLVLSALFVAVAHAYTGSWVLALLFNVGLQLLLLGVLLHQLRRWARDLTLPQSRAALVQAMEKMS